MNTDKTGQQAPIHRSPKDAKYSDKTHGVHVPNEDNTHGIFFTMQDQLRKNECLAVQEDDGGAGDRATRNKAE
eukprot:ANDGO_02686.mRNA.1 hypothetical protein